MTSASMPKIAIHAASTSRVNISPSPSLTVHNSAAPTGYLKKKIQILLYPLVSDIELAPVTQPKRQKGSTNLMQLSRFWRVYRSFHNAFMWW